MSAISVVLLVVLDVLFDSDHLQFLSSPHKLAEDMGNLGLKAMPTVNDADAFTTQQAEKFAALVKNEQALLEKAVVYALLNDMADTAVYIDFIRDDAGKGPIILFPGTEKPRKMLYIVFGSKVDTDKELEYGDLENAANDGRYNFNDLSDLATKFNLKKRMQIRTFLKE
ncbi:uncharacterized protein LOC127845938 [Dreissena polymorpha]|uniref:uncharacterized protein LOC127845938 n=1 Tax=Dreissena polymorpha TaxID=45954 RepID=UPI00226485C9|nr:uncharacterized protein LOC127845938 [Dreissena polymorpha]